MNATTRTVCVDGRPHIYATGNDAAAAFDRFVADAIACRTSAEVAHGGRHAIVRDGVLCTASSLPPLAGFVARVEGR